MNDTTVYIPVELARELDQIAKPEMRTRSAMARVLLRRAIDDLKASKANPRPYPAIPECPADTDGRDWLAFEADIPAPRISAPEADEATHE